MCSFVDTNNIQGFSDTVRALYGRIQNSVCPIRDNYMNDNHFVLQRYSGSLPSSIESNKSFVTSFLKDIRSFHKIIRIFFLGYTPTLEVAIGGLKLNKRATSVVSQLKS